MYKNIEEATKRLTEKQTVSLWGDEIEFTPEIASEISGDGKQILQITTISQRPQFWLIRIDSKIDVDDDDEFDIEKYIEILEDEFGRVDDDDFENSNKETIDFYPSIYWDGGLWGSVYNER